VKLYEISQNYSQLLDMVDVLDEETFRDTLQAIEEALEDKVENMAKFIRCLEADAKAIKEEEQRLADRRKALENRVSSVNEYLQNQMEVAGLDKVKRPTVTVSIQNNPPSVEIADESLIPSDYMIPQPSKIDKKSILSALKEGLVIEGCSMKQGRSVRIK
jgi:transcriptional regulator of heat shock response